MTVELADLLPGDVMFGPIGGLVPGVLPVGAGQLLLAARKERVTWRRWWRIRHVGMVEAKSIPATHYPRLPYPYVAPRIVEAMPRGARERSLSERDWTADHVYIRPGYPIQPSVPVGNLGWIRQGQAAANAARGYVGTPYNFLTYGKLTAGALRFRWTEELLARWISTRSDMMCSQLVDQSLADAGYHVFTDGRLPGDVTPAALFLGLLTLPGRWCIPGITGWLDNSVFPGFRN